MPGEPDAITAGDTLQFTHTDDTYTFEDWTLAYNLINASHFYSFQAAAGAGYDFSASVAASITGSWVPGVYRWVSFVAKGVPIERHQNEQGTLEIRPNWSAQTSGYDYRSHVKIVLDALEATIKGKASRDQMAYTIAGRSISRMTPAELLDWRNKYKAEYEAELCETDPNHARPGKVLIQFTGRYGTPSPWPGPWGRRWPY